MKKLLTFILFFFSLTAVAQFQNIHSYSSPYTLETALGGLKVNRGFVNTIYPDTATANLYPIATYPGGQIWVNDTIYIRNITADRWMAQGGGGGGGSTYTAGSGISISGDSIHLGGRTNSPAIFYDERSIGLNGHILKITSGYTDSTVGGSSGFWHFDDVPYSPIQIGRVDSLTGNDLALSVVPLSTINAIRVMKYGSGGKRVTGIYGHRFNFTHYANDSAVVRASGGSYNNTLQAEQRYRIDSNYSGTRTVYRTGTGSLTKSEAPAAISASTVIDNSDATKRLYIRGTLSGYMSKLFGGVLANDTLERFVHYNTGSNFTGSNKVLKMYAFSPTDLIGDSIWTFHEDQTIAYNYFKNGLSLGGGYTGIRNQFRNEYNSVLNDSVTINTMSAVTDTTGMDIVLRRRTDNTLVRIRADQLGVGGGGGGGGNTIYTGDGTIPDAARTISFGGNTIVWSGTSGSSIISVADNHTITGAVRVSSLGGSGSGFVAVDNDGDLSWSSGSGGGGATVGTYATRIALTPSDGDEFFQTDVARDAPPGKYYYLNTKWNYSPVALERLAWDFQDFNSVGAANAIIGNYVLTATGSGAAIAGGIRMSTASSATGRVVIYHGANGVPGFWYDADNGSMYMKVQLITLTQLSTGSEEFTLRIGFGDQTAGTEPNNGVYIEYDRTASVNWRYTQASGAGTRTETASSVPVTTGAHTLEIYCPGTGGTSEFWVDGVSIGTQASTMPTVAIGPFIQFTKTVGTTAVTADIDYAKVWHYLTTQRN